MKIEIEQDTTGTGPYRWSLWTGPERIDEYTGYCHTLGECLEMITKYKTINSLEYAEAPKND